MNLNPLEEDFIFDLAEDNFALYEVFHYVRSHYPAADDLEVLQRGRELVDTWIRRGWLAISPDEGFQPPGGLADLLPIIDHQGIGGTYDFEDAPWLTLGPKAREDIEFLRPAG